MRKFIKRSLIILGILVALLAGIGWYFSLRIKPILKQEISNQLAVEVEVSDIRLTSIFDFPKLGLTFKDVVVHESADFYHKPVLKAKELSLYVNLIKLLKKEYTIDAVTLKNGEVALADFDDFSNYDILKPDTSNSEAVDFAIKDIKLDQCAIQYQHLGSGFKISGHMEQSDAELTFEENSTYLSLTGLFNVDTISQAKDIYLKHQMVDLTGKIDVKDDGLVVIHPSELKIAEVQLTTEGKVLIDETVDIDLVFENEHAPLSSITTILPSYIQESIDHLDLDGSAQVKGYFKGLLDQNNDPGFGFTFSLEDGSVGVEGESIKLNQINSSGELKIPNLGDLSSAWVQLKLNRATSGTNALKGDIHIDNFNRPLIKWAGDASLDAKFISALMDNPQLKFTSGRIQTKSSLQLRYDIDKETVVANSFKFNGNILGQGIQGKAKDPDLNLRSVDFDLSATENKLAIKKCKIKYDESAAELSGYILELNSLFDEQSRSEVTGKLSLYNFNFNQFYSSDSSTTKTEFTSDLLPFKITLDTEIKNLIFNDFKAESVKGLMTGNQNSLVVDNARINALEGSIIADMKFIRKAKTYLLDINSKVTSVNISEMFRQFNEFDQQEITSKHLSGTLNGTIIAKVTFDPDFNVLLDRLYSKANINITDGQLINYEPLKELSAYVEVSELENVKFTSLTNTIEIFEETIYIPKMFIGNSALSLDIGGTHTFENYMNYTIGVNLAEVLSNKTNWLTNGKDKLIDRNSLGGLTAHISMVGTPDSLKISYNKTAAREALNQEVQNERRSFIRALNGEVEEDTLPANYYDDIWDE